MQSDISEQPWEMERLLADRGWVRLDGTVANEKLLTWLKKAALATIERELQSLDQESPASNPSQAAERILERSIRDRGHLSKLRCYTPFLKPWQIQNLIQWLQQKDAA